MTEQAIADAPPCSECHGTREVLGHADDCIDDLCALNGDMHSCVGKMEPCPTCGVKGLDPAKHTAAEIHGCEVTKWSNQQCVHGTYGCTATHGVPAAETQQENTK